MTLVSTLGQAMAQIERIKQQQVQLGDLQQQLATGKISDNFIGLGTNITVSERARADFNELDTYMANISRGNVRIEQKLTALDTIQKQAQNVADAMAGQPQEGEIDMDTIKRVAETAFDFVIQMLNVQDGDAYLFGGADSGTPPIRNTGSLDAFFSSLNPLWENGTLTVNPPNGDVTEEYMARYNAAGDANIGYSNSLKDAKKTLLRVDHNVEVDYTVLANDPAIRDILVTLGAIKNLPEVADAPGAGIQEKKDNFFKVFNELATKITETIDDVDGLKFKLNSAQVVMDQTEKIHTKDKNTLSNTISRVEDADLAETASKLQFLQIQLEATYRVTASIRNFSLVNFI